MKQAMKYNEDLKGAGFTPQESKTLLFIWGDMMESQLVTKEEFKSEMKELKTELRSEFQAGMKDLEVKLTLRLGVIMAGGVALMGLIIQLPHLLK